MKIMRVFIIILMGLFLVGCDRVYGVLHKPGGEERAVLGAVIFNEYNPSVEKLQQDLRLLGYRIGHADGKFGASTRDAVAKFQTDEGLEVTRFVDKATWARIQFYTQSSLVEHGAVNGKALQRALARLGFDPGKIDGQMGAQTKAAIRHFQKSQGLAPDGLLGVKTLRALIQKTTVKPAAAPES